MNEPSLEQKFIIDEILKYNVLVDSVAGCGKTTTVLHIAKKYSDKNILLLTYNKKLRLETKTKKEALLLNNLEVHTYHSFCTKYYYRSCYTDTVLRQVINNNCKIINKFSHYNIIVLDEAQDMTPLYFQLVHKIFNDFIDKTFNRICILGDKYQSIYAFNNADARFIINAKKLFGNELCPNNVDWIDAKLSTSFRLTNEMSKFINNCVLREERIKTNKIVPSTNIDRSFTLGSNVRYIICNCFNDTNNRIYNEVLLFLKEYTVNDIFILAPSLKSDQTGIRILANKLSKNDYAVHVPNSDDEKIDDDMLRNKIAFSTFHQVKGLERKVCIVFNVDESYFKYYKKNQNQQICPNEIYVALTRGSERLVVLHHETNSYASFIDVSKLKLNCYLELKPLKLCIYKAKIIKDKDRPTHIIDLLNYLPYDVIDNAFKYINFEQINVCGKTINIPTKIENLMVDGDIIYENVSDINSVALQAYFEFVTSNKMTINIKNKKFSTETLTPGKLLLLANTHCATNAGYIYKMNQITKYNWLKRKDLDLAVDRMKSIVVGKKLLFEINVNHENDDELMNKTICGKISCIDKNNVYLFKSTSELSKEHLMQLALLAYIYDFKIKGCNYYLYNILTDEMIKLNTDIEQLKIMVKYLIEYKFFNKYATDHDFIHNMKKLIIK